MSPKIPQLYKKKTPLIIISITKLKIPDGDGDDETLCAS
ncbi:GSCOCG00005426001-RA-CDS [Cotesia congregata]|nr:GSCOCG00005426001-RA-CDS [Cotesia congregata]